MLNTQYLCAFSSYSVVTFVISLFGFVFANCHFPVRLKPHKFASLQLKSQSDLTFNENFSEWKWKNIFISLIHSIISGFCALYLSYRYYHIENVIQIDHSHRHLLAFSLGYFSYDTWLSACKYGIYPGRGEIIGHHIITSIMLALVLLCPWSPFRELLPLCSVGLMIEFNNVFIHIRSLFELAGMKRSLLYRANSVLVLASVITFRFVPLYFILKQVVTSSSHIGNITVAVISIPIVAILAISLIIFYRLFSEDFLKCTFNQKTKHKD